MATAFPSPPGWPSNPFHEGEVEIQKRLDVQSHVMSYAPKVVRPFLPDQHREFYESLPFLVVACRDDRGKMWSTLLTDRSSGEAGFVTSPNPTTLSIRGGPSPGDALEKSFEPGSDVGIIGIEFAAKRRNRVNGRIVQNSNDSMEFRVDQSFGNCPQYIKPRKWWSAGRTKSADSISSSSRSDHLSPSQIETVNSAETVFIATGYRGQGEDPRFGNDASHRGGPPGFVQVAQGTTTILIQDFAGNDHFNSIGNLALDDRMGITIPLYETGGMIQLTGTATVDFDEEKAAANYPGSKRVIVFTVEEIVELPEGSIPVMWSSESDETGQRKLEVTRKVKESEDVTSFHLRPEKKDGASLWPFRSGQHLPISLVIDGKLLSRTYSLSSAPGWGEYRISVKREPLGAGSRFLHDDIQVGDILTVARPAGDFLLNCTSRPLLLVSTGVGVTPILSMLHEFVQRYPENKRKAYWVHGARSGHHHPFHAEVQELKKLVGDDLQTHVVYSRPTEDDTDHDLTGHINVELLQKLVPDLSDADTYMCGTGSFVAGIQDDLERLGVDPNYIHFETF
jgi:ferredoxin-NADP reductase/predicted pyridoxine 5'-phosphate oxidase superfamily flavin-nucleotide-binding protein